ncbi:MAG: recombinase family protein [Xanthobacteraceae bacterium]
MTKPITQKLRCAVYTRKSTEEGLELEFNSLDAQREACEAFIASQKQEGWLQLRDRYDDGGFSGGNLERPALKRLLADIEAGEVDVVVVYKIDRLSRSLMDFTRLVEVFDRHNVTFVSVTQAFNTTTSMGRLTLNILLSFGQFEREIIGERIRDKFPASRKKGIWMGGHPPLGYDVANRKLVINEREAEIVQRVFREFIKVGSTTKLSQKLNDEGLTTKGGHAINKSYLYKILNNRVYIGDAVHKGTPYPGEHDAIVDRASWDKVRAILDSDPQRRRNTARARTPALLRGLLFGPGGVTMTPTHTRRRGRLYRYYIAADMLKGVNNTSPLRRVSATDIEMAVVGQVRSLLQAPEIVVETWRKARKSFQGLTEFEVREAIASFGPLWDQLFPAEQSRIIQLLVERIDLHAEGIDIRLRVSGIASLLCELTSDTAENRDAA